MLAAVLLAVGLGAVAPESQPNFASDACRWLQTTTPVFDVQCPPSPERAAVAYPFSTEMPVLAVVVGYKRADRTALLVVVRRYDLPDSAYTRGWHVSLLRDWDSAKAVVKLEVLPKGHFDRVPPFTRPREWREVEEMDTPGQAILVSLADRRRWLFAPIQEQWRIVYLGIRHAE